ncbi:helix-turn-helix domain-containing protein, partial [Klebsiella pneumoniae]
MLGYELRLWRKGCGWTQERAAEEFDVSLRTYQMYEKNQRDIPLLAERATRELQLR